MALLAARALAVAQGTKGLTARNIAAEIGYSPGTPYNVFKDLDDIVVQLNARTLDELYDVLRDLPPNGDPETGVLEIARAYIGFVRSHPRLWNVLFEHNMPEGRKLPDWYYERVQRLLGLVSKALTPLFAANEHKQRDHSARVLWSATQGISALAGVGKLAQAESVDGLLRALITYHVRGLRASAEHPDFETA